MLDLTQNLTRLLQRLSDPLFFSQQLLCTSFYSLVSVIPQAYKASVLICQPMPPSDLPGYVLKLVCSCRGYAISFLWLHLGLQSCFSTPLSTAAVIYSAFPCNTVFLLVHFECVLRAPLSPPIPSIASSLHRFQRSKILRDSIL